MSIIIIITGGIRVPTDLESQRTERGQVKSGNIVGDQRKMTSKLEAFTITDTTVKHIVMNDRLAAAKISLYALCIIAAQR